MCCRATKLACQLEKPARYDEDLEQPTKKTSFLYSFDLRQMRNLVPAQIKTGEGNGTPLQYSCLENPMDGGAW